ncbi:MAG: UDP-N-acetylmuramoyl-L-alanine--D-glutamate ligase [Gammaproteobacteria bacterium]
MSLALQKDDLSNIRETIVIGLGETGLSVAQHLRKQNIAFTMLDTRSNPPQLSLFQKNFPDIKVCLEKHALEQLRKTARTTQLIVSPGVDIHQEAIRAAIVENNSECIGDIELFARSTSKPIAAVTGSNGKSTVSSLLAEMACSAGVRAYAGGNLGPPALDLLEHDAAELFVLEISSFQLESTKSLAPQVSVVLNISPDHLDRHGDVENYAQIKEHIYSRAKVSVVNRDDIYVSKMKTSGKVVSFGLDRPAQGDFGVIENAEDSFLALGENALLSVDELALPGESGILNSLAALALGNALNLPMQDMLSKLRKFRGLPHRLALVSKQNGVSWFNDSKGTNIGATISSLRSLGANIILIAGGVFKGGDLTLLKEVVDEHAKRVILLGQDASLLQQQLEGDVPVELACSMQDAVEIAERIATTNDQVLLSPACASFDMYENYVERGYDFESCVKGLSS